MQEGEESSPAPVPEDPTTPPPVPPREHLIRTAVKFLNNPNVVRSAINQKQAFLRTKGLSEDEIQAACERAGVFSNDPAAVQNHTVISMDVETSSNLPKVFSNANYALQPRQSWFGKLMDTLNSVAIISGLVYGAYLLYKKFLEPLIFRGKKKKPVEEQISDLNKNIEEKIEKVSLELTQIKEEVVRVSHAQNTSKELANFKTDLDSIKGLLLNRKQFASPNLPIVPPSIPAWQLQSRSQEQTPNSEGEPDKNDDNDTGSGSGSSENDVVLKNSDSSLEIIS